MATPSERTDGRGERGDKTARALLMAARRAFAATGFAGASVRDIAAAADANPALVRYHFGSKEKLYLRVVHDALETLRDRVMGALRHPAGGPSAIDAVVASLVDVAVTAMQEDPDLVRLLHRAWLDADGRMSGVLRQGLRPSIDAVKETLQKSGAAVGATPDASLSVLALAVGPYLFLGVPGPVFDEDTLSPQAVARRKQHVRDLLHRGLVGSPRVGLAGRSGD
jgi:AcrR family transcriptional regulator